MRKRTRVSPGRSPPPWAFLYVPPREPTEVRIASCIGPAADPKPIAVQGVLSLVHQDGGDIGGFQCVPYLFEHFDEWVKTQPADRDPHHPDMTGLENEVRKVELFPGDLMIFNSLLAHGVAPNRTEDKVRMAQYISMAPADEHDLVEREKRIRSWREREVPARAGYVGDPREWEKKNSTTAKLNELGEKLLGLKSWNH